MSLPKTGAQVALNLVTEGTLWLVGCLGFEPRVALSQDGVELCNYLTWSPHKAFFFIRRRERLGYNLHTCVHCARVCKRFFFVSPAYGIA